MNSKRRHPDYSFKVLLIGDSSVGKTSLMLRFSDNTFAESLKSTIGIDFRIKTMDIRNKQIQLQLWDTAGQEKFFNIARAYYRNADAVFLVFDRTQASSFQSISRWMKCIEDNAPDDVLRILVGNKCDLENELVISTDEARRLAERYQVDYFETSAKVDVSQNVTNMFYKITEKLIQRKTTANPLPSRTTSIELTKNPLNRMETCCSIGQ